jgi:hypothetical protein
VQKRTTAKEPQYQGYVWSFLFAATFTLWAVVGELVTVLLLFREIKTSGSIPDAAIWLMLVVVAAAVVGLFFYSWGSIGAIVKGQSLPVRRPQKHRELTMRYRSAYGPEGAAAVPDSGQIEPDLPPVSPL